MEDKNRRLEELLQTPCYSIDFLPQPIPPAALSQFRTIQHHLLNSEKRQEIKNRIVNILLNLHFHGILTSLSCRSHPMSPDSNMGNILCHFLF